MSKTQDGASVRKQRFKQILEIVKENENILEKQLKTKIAVETGLTLKRIEIYLDELREAGLIHFESGKITLLVELAEERTND